MPTPPITPPPSPLVLQTPARILVRKWVRNGLVPNAVFESELASALNFVAGVRNKQLFSGGCGIANIPDSDIVARNRWRFAAHTSPLLRRIKCTVLAARQNKGSGDQAAAVTLYIEDATGSTVYGSASFATGAAPALADTPDNFLDAELTISGVPADTTIYGRFEDGIAARLISACVYEESLKPTAANGYIVPSQCAATMPIYDARRKAIYELATRLWKRQGAHLLNWSIDTGSRWTMSSTATNIVDNTSTAVSTATPGYTIDLTYCRTRSKTTVPCIIAAYGSMSTGADTGEVRIVDDAGSTVGSVLFTSTTPSWQTAVVDMPASLAKYDLHFRCVTGGLGDTFDLEAVSLFQYAA